MNRNRKLEGLVGALAVSLILWNIIIWAIVGLVEAIRWLT